MSCKVPLVTSRVGAVGTLEGSFSGVGPKVILQLGHEGEGLTAVGAFVDRMLGL